MFHMFEQNAELARVRQQELRDMADKLHREQPRDSRSPVLVALGRQLINLGEKLQQSAYNAEQPTFELNTKRA